MGSPDVVGLVLAQVAAYNARDIERTLSFYTPDAVIVDGEGNVLDGDREAIRDAFEGVFAANPELHAEVPAAINVGEWVMIHSIVPTWPMADGSRGEMQWIELYQVVDGKIQRVQLFR
jgi:uncharacterized protein (TIGR02246 family)